MAVMLREDEGDNLWDGRIMRKESRIGDEDDVTIPGHIPAKMHPGIFCPAFGGAAPPGLHA